MRPQCQAQVDIKRRPPFSIILCPHFALDGSRWCEAHQDFDRRYPERIIEFIEQEIGIR